MDLLWGLTDAARDIASIIVTGILYARFLAHYLKKPSHAWEAGAAYALALTGMYMGYGVLHLDGMRAEAVGVAAVFAAAVLLECENINQKIFLAVTMYLVEWISVDVTNFLINGFYRAIVMAPYVEGHPTAQWGLFFVYKLAGILLDMLFMTCLFWLVNRAYRYQGDMERKELGAMLVVSLSVLVGNMGFRYFAGVYAEDLGKYIQEVHRGEWYGLRFLYQILSAAAIITGIVTCQNLKEAGRREKENARLSDQIASTKKHIEEVEGLYEDVRRLRHDLGNHVATLERLFLNNEPEETERYLHRMKEQLREVTPEIRTGNPVTDVILHQKKKEAEQRDICFSCDFHFPAKGAEAYDISMILNNALANAIESAGGSNPWVSVRSRQNQTVYMLEIRNSFAGRLEWDGSGLPVTTKEDRGEHGFGLRIIRKVAEKYFGGISIEAEDGEFALHVMLQCRGDDPA